MTQHFGQRLSEVFREKSHLCVGIDPHSWVLERWDLPDTAEGAREMGLRVVEACWSKVGIVKPQIAFFERFGSRGFAALERVLAEARQAQLVTIADVKRGDVGSTLAAYVSAWLENGSPGEADALTLNPYQGLGSLSESFEFAKARGKGVFVLAATSNPESPQFQSARLENNESMTVSRTIVESVALLNREKEAQELIASIGVVIGATTDLRALGIRVDELDMAKSTPILAPGFGFQGAEPASLHDIFGPLLSSVIVTESRSIVEHGPRDIDDVISRQAGRLEGIFG